MQNTGGANLNEVILYATPTGDLLAWCNDYFHIADQLGGTEAQKYPPHSVSYTHLTLPTSIQV